MNIVRLLRVSATISALIAVTFGLGTYTHTDFTNIHMLFGLIVALALLILAIMAVFVSGLRRLGTIGIVYAFIIPLLGVTQTMILAGDLHWLVEAIHLFVGFGALGLIGAIGTRLARHKATVSEVSATSQVA